MTTQVEQEIKTWYLNSAVVQPKEVEAYCFQKCGRIVFGGVIVMLEGVPFGHCLESKCPHAEKEIDLGIIEVQGVPFRVHAIVRKLKTTDEKPCEFLHVTDQMIRLCSYYGYDLVSSSVCDPLKCSKDADSKRSASPSTRRLPSTSQKALDKEEKST